jgi:hypothetical protein
MPGEARFCGRNSFSTAILACADKCGYKDAASCACLQDCNEYGSGACRRRHGNVLLLAKGIGPCRARLRTALARVLDLGALSGAQTRQWALAGRAVTPAG